MSCRHHRCCMIVIIVIVVDHSRVSRRVATDRRCQDHLHIHIHRHHHHHIHADGNIDRKIVEGVVRVKQRNQRSPGIIIIIANLVLVILWKKEEIMMDVVETLAEEV